MRAQDLLANGQWLPGTPASVPTARRFVRAVLVDADVPEHVQDEVLLLLSELVTNAVIHAGTELRASAVVTADQVRVEVEDGSSVTPSLRHYGEGASTGRGVSLVARTAERWGVEKRPGGKVVWFEVKISSVLQGEEALEVDWEALLEGDEFDLDLSQVIGEQRTGNEGEPTGFEVRYENLPVRLTQAALEHGDALLRELALLAFGLDEHLGQGTALDLDPVLNQLRYEHTTGREHTSFTTRFPDGSAEAAVRRLSLVDEANRMAQEGRALTPSAVPEVEACRAWLLSQVVHQYQGREPERWELPDPGALQVEWTGVSDEERTALDSAVEGVFVADESNHLVYVNQVGAEMLGWDQDDLTGRRLTTIIPPSLREAHLAGFTRHQLTGHQTVLGRPLSLPVLRKDDTLLNIELVINPIAPRGGRRRFQAHMTPSVEPPEARYQAADE